MNNKKALNKVGVNPYESKFPYQENNDKENNEDLIDAPVEGFDERGNPIENGTYASGEPIK